jgi:Skp family chaperone for outer membrane proteins
MWSQISARRMLYANPTIDITEQLIEHMNTAFAQGG